ncbi:nuclear transport factor 2 family protein [Croceicoccus bisphenolivorans]|uniref:nuclear transport factor 2 family protein n=1 Tax=Croceicoccus bisphenolivorans TaxID=1783232 RepID=UPI00082ADE3E|nr:nuclear transport factor 2 family protein [Croceicoccus bisphenolivorans]
MTPEEAERFIDELYAATGTGDWDKVATMVTDDLIIREAPGLPMGGNYIGSNALNDLFVKVFAMLDVASLETVARTYGGDYAVAILKMHFADESLAPAELTEVFRFRDGKVCEIVPYYFDPATIHAAAEAKQDN